MTSEDLERTCLAFEEEHGIGAFLDAMAAIMQRRLARQGFQVEFFDDEDEQPHQTIETSSQCEQRCLNVTD